MALFDSIRAGASGATESYQIERSLMFNDNDQTDLKRTPSSSGDRVGYILYSIYYILYTL